MSRLEKSVDFKSVKWTNFFNCKNVSLSLREVRIPKWHIRRKKATTQTREALINQISNSGCFNTSIRFPNQLTQTHINI